MLLLVLEVMQLHLTSLNTVMFFSNFMDSDGLLQGFLYWINSNLHSYQIQLQQPVWSSSAWVKALEYFTSHSISQKQENKPIKAGLLHKYAIHLNQCIPTESFIKFSVTVKKILQT